MADSEDQINLKKRARRRLVGAIALVTLVVIALPMVFDKESKPLSRDISIQIPNPNSGAFQNKVVPVPSSSSPQAPLPTQPGESAPAAAAPPSMQTLPQTSPPPATGPANAGAAPIPPAPPTGKKVEAKTVTAASAQGQPAAVPAKPVGAPARTGAQEGAWVVKMGAFADVTNVKRLQAQLSAAGIKSYTEPYESSDGTRTRVRAGPYATRAAAERAREKLKKIGLDGTVGEK